MKWNKTISGRTQLSGVIALAALLVFTGCGGGSGSAGKGGSGSRDGQVSEGMSECTVEEAKISYSVFVKVTTDAEGKILSVEDAGTEVPGGKDDLYKKAQALFQDLAGKNADTIREVDAVTGATRSSEAILSAVQQALENK